MCSLTALIEHTDHRVVRDGPNGDGPTEEGVTSTTAATVVAPMVADESGLADQKLCGSDVDDAAGGCVRDQHCHVGDECPLGGHCFVVVG
jgi:hypothetical protein